MLLNICSELLYTNQYMILNLWHFDIFDIFLHSRDTFVVLAEQFALFFLVLYRAALLTNSHTKKWNGTSQLGAGVDVLPVG